MKRASALSRSALLASVASAIVLGGTVSANAQELDQIIVTAQKREQDIQRVSVAVQAFDAQALVDSNIIEVDDLNFSSPSVNITLQQSRVSNTPVRIRGFGTTGTNPAFEGAVGTYIDGVYRSRAGFAISTFNDIGALEVLRGPQGTLFGKNSSSGAILLTSNRPEFENTFGVDINVGNFDYIRTEGFANFAASDTLAVRLAGNLNKRNGYITNNIREDGAGNIDQFGFKGQLLWEPMDRFSAHIIGDYAEANDGGIDATSTRIIQGAPAAEGFYAGLAAGVGLPWYDDPVDPFRREEASNTISDDDTVDWGIVGTLNYDLTDTLSVKSISSYRIFDYTQSGFDFDFGPAPISGLNSGLSEDFRFKTFSQELNLNGGIDGLFNGADFLLGAYYSSEDLRFGRSVENGPALGLSYGLLFEATLGLVDIVEFPSAFDGTPGLPQATLLPGGAAANGGLPTVAEPGALFLNAAFDQTDDVFAFFGHLDVALTDQFNLVGGVRYNNEEKNAVLTNLDFPGDPLSYFQTIADRNFGTFLLGASTVGREFDSTQKDEEITWDVALQYFPTDDLQLYAKVSRGYKAGGVSLNVDAGGMVPSAAAFAASGNTNPFTPEVSPNYDPEFVNAYEAGAKFDFADGRGRGAITGFYQDYSDIQFSIFTGTAFATFNASSAVSAGLEVESMFAVTEALTVEGNLTWLADASFGDDDVDPLNPAVLPNVPGRDFSHAPTLASVVNVKYETPVTSNLLGFVNLGWAYFGDHFLSIDQDNVQDGYHQMNGSIGITTEDRDLRIELWARNINDAEFIIADFNQPFVFTGGVHGYAGPPRTWGVRFRKTF